MRETFVTIAWLFHWTTLRSYFCFILNLTKGDYVYLWSEKFLKETNSMGICGSCTDAGFSSEEIHDIQDKNKMLKYQNYTITKDSIQCDGIKEYSQNSLESTFLRSRTIFMIIEKYEFTTKPPNLEYMASKLFCGLSVGILILNQESRILFKKGSSAKES